VIREERKRAEIQAKMQALAEELNRVNSSIARKTAARNDYDALVRETEAAYLKILESSQTLLHVLKKETQTLTQKDGHMNGNSGVAGF
jgi:sjoegren syndrome nuclear autoantigen 1